MSEFNEASYENSIVELLENLGYTHVYGPDVERNFRTYCMSDELRMSLERINPTLPSAAIDEALFKINNYEAVALVAKNEVFMDYLQNGVQVSYQDKGETRSGLVYLVNYYDPSKNSFILAIQWTV